MSGGKKLWRDAAVLTLGSLALRCAGLLFQVILAGRLGTEWLGLFQPILSVFGLAVALAAAGAACAVSFLLRLLGLSPNFVFGLTGHILLTAAAYAALTLALSRARRVKT